MMKYQELLKNAEAELAEKGIAENRIDAWYLFSDAFHMSKSDFLMDCRREIPAEQEAGTEKFEKYIAMRGKRIPLQQILGTQEFMGLPFMVNEHVLIPRQDTETLAEEAITAARAYYHEAPVRILDLCTGSGCIGISVTAEIKKGCAVQTVLSDISGEALKVAEQNIAANGLERECTICRSDLFEKMDGEKFHMILSNPPYIPSKVIETLEPEVKDHEPRLALDGMEDGLYYYKKIADEAGEHLVSGGCIYLEIGYDQSEDVENLLRGAGFEEVKTIRDLCGQTRVVTGIKR